MEMATIQKQPLGGNATGTTATENSTQNKENNYCVNLLPLGMCILKLNGSVISGNCTSMLTEALLTAAKPCPSTDKDKKTR